MESKLLLDLLGLTAAMRINLSCDVMEKTAHRMGRSVLLNAIAALLLCSTATSEAAGGAGIITQPVNQAVQLGGTATFSVTANGQGLVYMWFCNGSPIPAENGSSLRITNVRPENAGLYYAQIIDQNGHVAAQTDLVRLTIPSSDLAIIAQPENQKVLLGTEAAFFVVAASSQPLSYLWLRNGVAIPEAKEARLAIPGTLEVNAGTYVVRVSTPTGAVLSDPADLIYSIQPSINILTPPFSQGVLRNGSVRFEVVATGPGALTYTWRHNATKISSGPSPFINLANVQPADAGEYWVTVQGGDGTAANAMASLVVHWLEMEPIADVSVKQGTSSLPVPIKLRGDAASLASASLSAASSNPGLLSAEDILFGGSDAQRFMIILAKPNSSGIARVRVTATDRGQSASTELIVSVVGPNTPPTIVNLPAAHEAVLGQLITIPFQVADKETDSSALQVEARLIGGSSGLVQVVGSQADRLLIVKAEPTIAGTVSCLVTVRDAAGAATERIVSLTIAGPSLQISQDGPELVIAYPDSAPSAVVEYRYGLAKAEAWRSISYVPASVGGMKVIRIPAPLNSTFFRLRF